MYGFIFRFAVIRDRVRERVPFFRTHEPLRTRRSKTPDETDRLEPTVYYRSHAFLKSTTYSLIQLIFFDTMQASSNL